MPTTLPRTQITHTPPVHHALDVAAREWPQERNKPGVLLVNLVVKAASDLEAQQAQRRRARQARLRAVAGRFPGLYPPQYLDEIRQGWPA